MAYVEYTKEAHVVTIRLNRPERLNAMGGQVRDEFAVACGRFIEDDDAWVAILTGTGRAFCAGVDLKGEPDYVPNPDALAVRMNRLHTPETDKPIIAAINGICVGYGWFLLCGSDIRVAAEGATFSMGEVNAGLIGPYYLAINSVIPWAVSAEIAMLGRFHSAQRLFELGMVNQVVPAERLMEAAQEYAEAFTKLSQPLLRATKQLMNQTRLWPRGDVVWEQVRLADWLRSRRDTKEARSSFVEKRAPSFTGE